MISIVLYNEAGEQVAVIADGIEREDRMEKMEFAGDIDIINDDQGNIIVVFPDGSTFEWLGLDENGNEVSNGTYLVQIENVDRTGLVTTVTKSVSVIRSASLVTVRVYNEAGELVWETELTENVTEAMGQVSLSTDEVDPGSDHVDKNSVVIDLGGEGEVVWDGRDSAGNIVGNGAYLVEVRVQTGGEEVLFTRTVTVLHGELEVFDGISISPNPVINAGSVTISTIGGDVSYLTVNIYNLAGELIRKLHTQGNSVEWGLDITQGWPVAGGVYVAVVEAVGSDGTREQQLVRIVVLR
jgi:flagellar hook assembly protein FlgD